MDDTNYYENMIAELRAERDALAELLRRARAALPDMKYCAQLCYEIAAALAKEKP